MKRKTTSVVSAMHLRSGHPLVGTWEQVDNPFHKTSVVYKIAVLDGKLVLSGWDEVDGELFKVSKVKWDGEALHFTTFFPPTKYSARHVMRLIGRRRANHKVDGDHELWQKRPKKRDARASRQSSI